MIRGTVTIELIDRRSGEVVRRRTIRNATTTLGRRVLWGLITGADTGHITGTAAQIDITYSGGKKTLASPHQPWDVGANQPDNPHVRFDTQAEARWRWLDFSGDVYTATSVELVRDPTEGVLAVIDIDAADQIAKPSTMNLQVTWTMDGHTGDGDDDGVGNPDVVTMRGIAELFRAVISDGRTYFRSADLEAALVASVTPADPGEDPRQGAGSNEATLTMSNFRTRSDNPDLPSNALQFDLDIDGDTIPQAGFTAQGLEFRVRWGGRMGESEQTVQRRTFHRSPLDSAITINPGDSWSMADVSYGIFNA